MEDSPRAVRLKDQAHQRKLLDQWKTSIQRQEREQRERERGHHNSVPPQDFEPNTLDNFNMRHRHNNTYRDASAVPGAATSQESRRHRHHESDVELPQQYQHASPHKTHFTKEDLERAVQEALQQQKMSAMQQELDDLKAKLEAREHRDSPRRSRTMVIRKGLNLPDNELRPPEGFLIPGIPEVEDLIPVVRTDGSSNTTVQFEVDNIRQGDKLHLIKSALPPTCDNLDRLGGNMELAATNVREYMQRLLPQPSDDPTDDQVTPQETAPDTNRPDLLFAQSFWAKDFEQVSEEQSWIDGVVNVTTTTNKGIGFPVSDRAKDMLGRVAYSAADQTGAKEEFTMPTRHQVCRIPREDWVMCAKYNTDLTDKEMPVICAGEASSKSDAAIIKMQVRSYDDNKYNEEVDRIHNNITSGAGALKSALSAQSAAESIRLATSLTLNSLQSVQQRLDSLAVDPKSREDLRAIQDSVSYALEDTEAARLAAYYADQASLAAAEAAAQSNRHQMLRLRSITVEALNNVPPAKLAKSTKMAKRVPHPLARAAQRLPVVPSSLCGGRLFTSVKNLGVLAEANAAFREISKNYGGDPTIGAKPTSNKGKGKVSKRPFRRTGKKKTGRSRGGGGQGQSQGGANNTNSTRPNNNNYSGNNNNNNNKPETSSFNKQKHNKKKRGPGGGGGGNKQKRT